MCGQMWGKENWNWCAVIKCRQAVLSVPGNYQDLGGGGPGSSFGPVIQWANLNSLSVVDSKILKLVRCINKKDIFSPNFELLASYPCEDS